MSGGNVSKTFETPLDQLVAAEAGFDLSHAFVPTDANYLRMGAAVMARAALENEIYYVTRELGQTSND